MQGIQVARFGRPVGIKGGILLHLVTDFPSSLKPKAPLFCEGDSLTLRTFDPKSMVAYFHEIPSREVAASFTNKMLCTTAEYTLQECPLADSEYFWFQIIGCELFEDSECLGKVVDIERFGNVDYLVIECSDSLFKRFNVKQFLLPYLDKFIASVDVETLRIESRGAKGIAEAS